VSFTDSLNAPSLPSRSVRGIRVWHAVNAIREPLYLFPMPLACRHVKANHVLRLRGCVLPITRSRIGLVTGFVCRRMLRRTEAPAGGRRTMDRTRVID
jgi:hypothetical protein